MLPPDCVIAPRRRWQTRTAADRAGVAVPSDLFADFGAEIGRPEVLAGEYRCVFAFTVGIAGERNDELVWRTKSIHGRCVLCL